MRKFKEILNEKYSSKDDISFSDLPSEHQKLFKQIGFKPTDIFTDTGSVIQGIKKSTSTLMSDQAKILTKSKLFRGIEADNKKLIIILDQ